MAARPVSLEEIDQQIAAPEFGVVDGDRCLGVLTPDNLHAALRKSLAEDA